MRRGVTGQYVPVSTVGGERVRAFIPAPLPPRPPLSIGPDLRSQLDEALLALGRLDSVTSLLPDTELFLYHYIRKEAVLSSQIEGTQSSLSDLLLFEAKEAPGVPVNDVEEVSGYVAAMYHGLKRIADGLPLSNRLIREMHGILLGRGRGSDQSPGEFRRSQNWIGGSRPGTAVYVPPPSEMVAEQMGTLEKWLHDLPERTPTLIKAAMAHVQFESIHPFLDGNGRLGRLLITLILCAEHTLKDPLLYLSLYLKRNRDAYYALLESVRREGDWEAWLSFFAEGVRESAAGAVTTVQRLAQLARNDRDRIQTLGRSAGSVQRMHHALQERPIGSASLFSQRSGLSMPVVIRSLETLRGMKLVEEITGRRRNRVYVYQPYLNILSEGTEPIR